MYRSSRKQRGGVVSYFPRSLQNGNEPTTSYYLRTAKRRHNGKKEGLGRTKGHTTHDSSLHIPHPPPPLAFTLYPLIPPLANATSQEPGARCQGARGNRAQDGDQLVSCDSYICISILLPPCHRTRQFLPTSPCLPWADGGCNDLVIDMVEFQVHVYDSSTDIAGMDGVG